MAKETKEQKPPEEGKDGKLVPVEALEERLKIAEADAKSAQLQRDWLKDVKRVTDIFCPICKYAKIGERRQDGSVEGICPKFRTNKADCKHVRAMTQLIPVKEGKICLDAQLPNPNIRLGLEN